MRSQLQIDANNAFSEKSICTNVPVPEIEEAKWECETVKFGKKATLIVKTKDALGCKVIVKFRSPDWSSCFVDVFDVNSRDFEGTLCEFTPKTEFLIERSKNEVDMYADVWLLQSSPWGISLTTGDFDRLKGTYIMLEPVQCSTIPRQLLGFNITECCSTSVKCTIKKIVIVLDPGHGHKIGTTGTSARYYNHRVKDDTRPDIIKKDEEGNDVIVKSTYSDIPSYVYSNSDACRKYIVDINSDIPRCRDWSERIIVFEVAVCMKRKLEEIGYEVYLTRDQVLVEMGVDGQADLFERNRFSNSKNADYFISIHVNGNLHQATYKRGAFYMYRGDDEEYVTDRVKELGRYLLKYFKPYGKDNTDFIPVITDNDLQQKQLAVLSSDKTKGNKAMYKSLVEVGTYTNPNDAKILYDNKSTIHESISSQLLQGLNEHINNIFLK